MSRSLWSTLGIKATNDQAEIRRAYARRLKEVHPEDDPEGFQALRAAYDQALSMARKGWAAPRAYRPHPDDGEANTGDWASDEVEAWPDDDEDGWQSPSRSSGIGPGWNGADSGPQWARPDPADGPVPAAETAPDLAADIAATLKANADEAQAHEQLIRDLSQQIGIAPNEPEPALQALIKVLRSPAMTSMAIHERTELWLADLLLRPGDATAGLIEPVAHYFGWTNARVGVDLRHAQAALARRDALEEIRRLRRPESGSYRAFKALTQPVTGKTRLTARLTPGLAGEVWALLDRADYALPQLADSFDPGAVQWWRDLFARPRLGPMFLLFALFGPPIFTAMIMAGRAFEAPTLLDAVAVWVLLFGMIVGLGAGWLKGIAGPTLRWRSDNPWEKPLALRFGWLAAAVPLALVGALVPPLIVPWSLALVTGLLFLWLVLAVWTRLTTSHVGRASPEGNNLGFGFFCLVLLAAPALLSPLLEGRTDPMTVTLLGLGLVAFLGRHALLDEWHHLSQPHRRQVTFGLIALSSLAIALAFLATSSLLVAVAMVLVAMAALPGRLLPLDVQPPWPLFQMLATRGGWVAIGIVALSQTGPRGLQTTGQVAAIVLVLPTLILALSEVSWPQPKSRRV